MLVQSMSRGMESIGPISTNGVQPEQPGQSDALAGAIYDQMRAEFFVAGPFVLHHEIPELLAAAWTLVRETLLVGEANRGQKEIVAWAVSQGNRCSFCVDTHGRAKAAAKADDTLLERWARSSTSADGVSEVAAPSDLDRHRAEYLGTLTAFHYLNRMANVLLSDKADPAPGVINCMTRSMAKVMMGGILNKGVGLVPGESLPLLPEHDSITAWRPGWAADSATVLSAMAGWSTVIENEAAERFAPTLLAMLGNRFARWDGEPQPREFANMEPLARLAVLTVEAPHRVTTDDVDASIAASSSADTLAMVAWAAQRAARRCAGWANIDG